LVFFTVSVFSVIFFYFSQFNQFFWEGKGKKGKVEGGEGGWRLKIKGKSGLGLGMMFFISFFFKSVRFGPVQSV
jgi:hypothetical protein